MPRARSTCPIMLVDCSTPELVTDAFSAGAKGIVCRDAPFEVLCKCIQRVHAGQVWVNSQELQWILKSLATREPVHVVNALGIPLLTKREEQIVQLVAEGLPSREIASKLGVSAHTVKNHLFRIYEKLGVSNRSDQMPDPPWFGLCNQVGHGSAEGVPDQAHLIEVESAKNFRAHPSTSTPVSTSCRCASASVTTQINCVHPVLGCQCLGHHTPVAALLGKSVEKHHGRESDVSCNGKCQINSVDLDAGHLTHRRDATTVLTAPRCIPPSYGEGVQTSLGAVGREQPKVT